MNYWQPFPSSSKYSMEGIRYPKPRVRLNGFTIAYAMWLAGSFLVVFGVLALGGLK